MNDSLITVRYVKALYQLADEENIQDAVKDDMELLLLCIKESVEFEDFLHNVLLQNSEKLKIIDNLFKKVLQDLSLKFLHLLIANKREMYLLNICHYFISYYKEKQEIKEAAITTAKALSISHRKEILDFITKKFKIQVELQELVNPAIIGGFILRIEDRQINASLGAQLNKIKRELINS